MFRRTYKKTLAERAADFAQTAEHHAYQLRLDLTDLIVQGLRRNNMSQKDLADRYGSESFISRLVNSNANCTFGVAARVLFALGIRPKLVDAGEWESMKRELEARSTTGPTVARRVTDAITNTESAGSDYAAPGRWVGGDTTTYSTSAVARTESHPAHALV